MIDRMGDMKIYIVAGGPKELLPNLTSYQHHDVQWIGVDRGVIHLLEFGIIPDFAFGDFDSITEKEQDQINRQLSHIEVFPAQKDKTDSEIGMDFALSQENVEEIILFGASGGRLDHLLGNIHILLKTLKQNIKAKLIDVQNEICLFDKGTYNIEQSSKYRYVSFLPITEEIKGLTLKGFKYSLNNCHIKLGSTLCISNELIHSIGTFSFSDGILMMIRSCDEPKKPVIN